MNQDSEANSKDPKKCPKCATVLHFVDDIGNHYCFECEEYFDETLRLVGSDEAQPDLPSDDGDADEGEMEKPVCPSCGKPTERIDESDRYFCYGCEDYFTQGVPSTPDTEEESVAVEEPEIGEEAEEEPSSEDEIKTEPKEPAAVSAPDVSNCIECGSILRYIERYDRYYCDLCKKYAPKDFKLEESRRCPACGGEAIFIQKYGRWYCRACKQYLPKEPQGDSGKPLEKKSEPVKSSTPGCIQCGGQTRLIEKYGRYYCEKCNRYNPKEGGDGGDTSRKEAVSEGPICSVCGKKTSYISKYDRFYCYDCRKYAPKKTKQPQRTRTVKEAKVNTAPVCPECGQPSKFMAKYQRFYCYQCKRYMPKKG